MENKKKKCSNQIIYRKRLKIPVQVKIIKIKINIIGIMMNKVIYKRNKNLHPIRMTVKIMAKLLTTTITTKCYLNTVVKYSIRVSKTHLQG